MLNTVNEVVGVLDGVFLPKAISNWWIVPGRFNRSHNCLSMQAHVFYGVHIESYNRTESSCNVLFKITCGYCSVWTCLIILNDEIIAKIMNCREHLYNAFNAVNLVTIVLTVSHQHGGGGNLIHLQRHHGTITWHQCSCDVAPIQAIDSDVIGQSRPSGSMACWLSIRC